MTNCMVDLKPNVRVAATDALTKCCTAIGNRDIEPFVPHLIRCIGAPAAVADCVHKLSATTFVQSVDSRTLSILVPLLVRGLTDRTTPIRRKACVIIRNMAKVGGHPCCWVQLAGVGGCRGCLLAQSNPHIQNSRPASCGRFRSVSTPLPFLSAFPYSPPPPACLPACLTSPHPLPCLPRLQLVDDPVDAANFVATLLPNVKYAMEGMSNPEAREVATDCHKILESINTTVEAAPKASTEEVLAVSVGGRQAGRQAGGGRSWSAC